MLKILNIHPGFPELKHTLIPSLRVVEAGGKSAHNSTPFIPPGFLSFFLFFFFIYFKI